MPNVILRRLVNGKEMEEKKKYQERWQYEKYSVYTASFEDKKKKKNTESMKAALHL